MFRAQILHRESVCRVQIPEFQNYVQVLFRPKDISDKNYVERLYTIFISLCETFFHAFYVTDMRYDTISVCFIKSCLLLILSAGKLQVVRKYTSFITYRMYCFKTNVYNVCM